MDWGTNQIRLGTRKTGAGHASVSVLLPTSRSLVSEKNARCNFVTEPSHVTSVRGWDVSFMTNEVWRWKRRNIVTHKDPGQSETQCAAISENTHWRTRLTEIAVT
jgi:hypothetical protein